MIRTLGLIAALTAATASAAKFTIVLQNTATNGYGWSAGLVTLKPLINVGVASPRSGNFYFTYRFANSHCDLPTDSFCSGTCNDNGNAAVLAARWGLTLGVDAWLVPALPAGSNPYPVTFEAPVGSKVSYIAWVSDTSVFDDFVAIHPPGQLNNLEVPLFNGTQPLENVDFVINGYDTNSTSATDGSGDTCAAECPASISGCFVAPGNASQGAGGSFPTPATPNVTNFTISTSSGQNRLVWTNIGPHQGVVVARQGTAVTWAPTTGTTYTTGQEFGAVAATGSINPVTRNNIIDGETFTLSDGTNPQVVFEFDKTNPASIKAGNIRVAITANNMSETQVGAAIVSAINGVAGSLRITASNSTTRPYVRLVNDVPGLKGNIAMAEAVTNGNFSVPGMGGGTAPVTTIVYADNGATASNKFTDTSAAAGAPAYYKVFAHANTLRYANGTVPALAGVFSEATSSTGNSPLWCYAVGMPSLQQPITKVGVAVYTSSQTGALTSSLSAPGTPATNGNEQWRPVQLQGATQIRPLVVSSQIGDLLITGDQLGYGYAVNPANGSIAWQAIDGGKMGNGLLGSGIQAQPAVQLYSRSNAAFRNSPAGAGPRDLIFFATRNSSGSTDNVIYALSSRNGNVVWSTPTNAGLGMVSGTMAVHYDTNRLYVGASNGLWIYDTLTGTRLAGPLAVGALNFGVNFDYDTAGINGLSLINTAGLATGLSLDGGIRWGPVDVGPTTTFTYPTGNGFIATLQSGAVKRYFLAAQPDGGTSVNIAFSVNPDAGRPTGMVIDYPAPAKIYIGTLTGKLLKMDYYTGAVDRAINTSSTSGVGPPSIDTTTRRLHVGTFDGRLCAYPVPFQ